MDRYVVLGANGVVGRSLVRILQEKNIKYKAYTRDDCDWDYDFFLNFNGDDVVINLMAEKTTIAMNREKPATILANTLSINKNVLHACTLGRVKKLVNIVSSCAYPGNNNGELREEEFWNGTPHESIRPHGLAKQCVYALSQACRKEFGLNVICLCFNSLFGNTLWDRPDTLKVLESLVKKFVDAREANLPEVVLWGSGEVYREFLYVDDAANSILQAVEKYEDGEILNVGHGHDIQIKKLAEGIALAVGYKGNIVWDTTKPDGQYRKLLSSEKMMRTLNWFPPTPLVDGIDLLIADYEGNK